MLLQVCAYIITVLIYIDRTALYLMCIYHIYYYYYFIFSVCVGQSNMCLSCSIDIVSICANKEIYNNSNYGHNILQLQFHSKLNFIPN